MKTWSFLQVHNGHYLGIKLQPICDSIMLMGCNLLTCLIFIGQITIVVVLEMSFGLVFAYVFIVHILVPTKQVVVN